ncbi:MAG TPA: tRNA pseudouridine(38-40) synthase TruA [Spirochaetia bacterium]|nr:tRNA pseudouridine(38-40) synthase TruA [Spirochaetia bacterium]
MHDPLPFRNIRMTVAYDGTDFLGWQVQPVGRTVQGEILRALEKMHRHPVKVYAAGRTDSGVHADGQVINFSTDIASIPAEDYFVALNSYLPRDVQALASRAVDDSFHARYSALRRVYRYSWSHSPTISPAIRARVVRVKHRPCIARLNALARPLLGTHDFSTFTPPTEPSESRVRTLESAGFYPTGGLIVLQVAANAFLWRMVRSIAGTLMELDKIGAEPIEVEQRLAARNHAAAGPSAPAQGLSLHRVDYPGDPFGGFE